MYPEVSEEKQLSGNLYATVFNADRTNTPVVFERVTNAFESKNLKWVNKPGEDITGIFKEGENNNFSGDLSEEKHWEYGRGVSVEFDEKTKHMKERLDKEIFKTDKKVFLIVSHQDFLTKLVELLEDKGFDGYAYNRLDDKSDFYTEKKSNGKTILRMNNLGVFSFKLTKGNISKIFIFVRHCHGCHNLYGKNWHEITTGISKKYGRYSYGLFAKCTGMDQEKYQLTCGKISDIIQKNVGFYVSFKNYMKNKVQYCSSPLFRTITTSYFLINELQNFDASLL